MVKLMLASTEDEETPSISFNIALRKESFFLQRELSTETKRFTVGYYSSRSRNQHAYFQNTSTIISIASFFANHFMKI